MLKRISTFIITATMMLAAAQRAQAATRTWGGGSVASGTDGEETNNCTIIENYVEEKDDIESGCLKNT